MSILNGAPAPDFSPAVFVALLLGIGFFALISYILSGITYYTMAKNEGLENPWLAWIPIANVYIMGELLNEKLKGSGGLKLLIAYIVLSVLAQIPLLQFVFAPLLMLASFVVLYWMFEKYSDKPVLHLVLSLVLIVTIIGAFYSTIALFVLRNKKARF